MSGGGMGGQSYGGGYGGGMGGYGQPSRFGSNPMQTRPWMQPGYGQSQTGASVDSGFHPMTKPLQMPTGPQGFPGANGSPGNEGQMDSGMHPMPPRPQYYPGGGQVDSGSHSMPQAPSYEQFAQSPLQAKSQPFIPNPSVDRNSLIRPDAMMDPALAKPPPPMPTGPMQPGQSDWQFNNGFANGSPGTGFVPGFLPGQQRYISGNLPNFSQQQLGQLDWNNLLQSISGLNGGQTYESQRNIYG